MIADLARARDRLARPTCLHPPDAALPRAVRLRGGRVPGRRGGRRALAGAAVLPGDDARDRSSGSARRSARASAPGLGMTLAADGLVQTRRGAARAASALRVASRRDRRPRWSATACATAVRLRAARGVATAPNLRPPGRPSARRSCSPSACHDSVTLTAASRRREGAGLARRDRRSRPGGTSARAGGSAPDASAFHQLGPARMASSAPTVGRGGSRTGSRSRRAVRAGCSARSRCARSNARGYVVDGFDRRPRRRVRSCRCSARDRSRMPGFKP